MKNFKIHYNEDELLQAISLGNTKAFEALYQSYKKVLFGITYRILGGDPPAQDVFQESMMNVWHKIHLFDPTKGTLFTWLLNICRNHAIDHLRTKAHRTKALSLGSLSALPSADNLPGEYWGIREAVAKLDDSKRILIEMAYFEGYSQTEIAENLDIPLGTVKSRIRAAMLELRMLLQDIVLN